MSSSTATKKKSYYNQAFNDEWLKDSELRDWIKRVPNEKYAVLCKICNTELVNTNRTGLIAHKNTNKHFKNSEAKNNVATLASADMESSNYSEQLLESFESFRKDGLFCDTIIVIGEKQLKAHGVVLAAASSVFRAALESSAEPGLHYLNLSGYDFEVLETAVRFIYTGQLEVETKYASSEKLGELLTSLEDLGLCLDQYRSCEMTFSSEAEELSNGSLGVKTEEGNDVLEIVTNSLHREDRRNSSADGQLSVSSGLGEIKQEDVKILATLPSSDSLVLNEVTNGWVLRSETGVHVVEIPAGTLAEVQLGFHKQKDVKRYKRVGENHLRDANNDLDCEKGFNRAKKRKTMKTNDSESSVISQDNSDDAQSMVSCELPSTDSPAEVMHEELPDYVVKKKRRQRLVCPTCGKTFGKIDHFTLHLRVHTGEKPYACDICQKVFSFVNNLQRHMRSHTGDKRYLCHLCGSAFIQKTTLEDHIAVHTKEKKHPCKLCGKFFKSSSCLRAHSKRHKLGSVRNRHENLDQPGLSDSVKHAESILMDNGFVRFVCKICKRDYASKNSLAIHVQHHSSTKPFACNLCKKSFWQRAHLEIHERTHTGERPFTCNTCGKSFTYAGGLITHVRLHTGEKPYRCDICNSAYTQQAHLKSHLRTHSGEKPYECKACGKRYRNKVDLRFHLKRNDACNKVS